MSDGRLIARRWDFVMREIDNLPHSWAQFLDRMADFDHIEAMSSNGQLEWYELNLEWINGQIEAERMN